MIPRRPSRFTRLCLPLSPLPVEAHHLSRTDNVVDSAPRLEGILAGGAEPLKEAVPGFPGATTGDVDSELGVPEVALEAQPPGTKLHPACSPSPAGLPPGPRKGGKSLCMRTRVSGGARMGR